MGTSVIFSMINEKATSRVLSSFAFFFLRLPPSEGRISCGLSHFHDKVEFSMCHGACDIRNLYSSLKCGASIVEISFILWQ
jgi:hypothetical protein